MGGEEENIRKGPVQKSDMRWGIVNGDKQR